MTTTTPDQRVSQQIPRTHDVLDEDITRTTAKRDTLRQFRTVRTDRYPTTLTPPSQNKNTSTDLTRLTAMIGSPNQNQHQHQQTGSDGLGLLHRVRDAYRGDRHGRPPIR